MPRITQPLTDAKCDAAKPREKAYKLYDGGGLHLLVRPTGKKTWRLKYTRPNGAENTLTIGDYSRTGTSLAKARSARQAAKDLLAQGVDPAEQSRIKKAKATGATTFEAVARQWHADQLRRGKWSASHGERVIRELEADIFPAIGRHAIDSLRTRDLLAPLRQVEARDALEMASRLKQRIVGIMRHAVQNGLIEHNPALDLAGATATRKITHRPALPLERLGELQERIERYSGRPLTRLALLLTLHVFIRSSELRFARWPEIDLKRGLWIIPPERAPLPGVKHSQRGSKMRDEHLVPLSLQAKTILQEINLLSGSGELVFPSDSSPSRPMSENTVNAALRRLGYDTKAEVCGHGFRTMACSALVESGLWSRDAVERQMSHQERSNVRAAYIHRAEHLQERRLMMSWWSSYLGAVREHYIPPFEWDSAPSAKAARIKAV